MKKLISVLLIFVITLSFAACNTGDTVTIYIPETMTIYWKDDSSSAVVEYIFEEGWEGKESFAVSFDGAVEAIGTHTTSFTYGDHCLVTLMEDATRTETRFDKDGQVIGQITEYLLDAINMTKMETTYTYDANGRILRSQSKSYYPNREEPVEQSYTYTYKSTEQGSEGTARIGDTTETRIYDKRYRLLEHYQTISKENIARFVYAYDEHGNRICAENYVNGERITKTVTTYKAVQVSKGTADRLPQFKREN